MARDNVTFKFRIDLTQMTVKGKQAIKILEDIEMKSGKAAAGMSRMGTASVKSGQQTAAAAINFQTATQGMLNLSTAAVQTYTSISNLARANNRASMSVIAVARAEDLLANKIERQNTLRESGLAGSQKYVNITKEIATATADLTVKEEKMGIEKDAVNDIYMLFATNIANVTISSMQTIAILDKNSIILGKAKAIGMKINNFLSLTQVRLSWNQARANGVEAAAKAGLTGATASLTVATYGLAGASKALMLANLPLFAAMAALTVAWVLYEKNVGGVKTAIEKLMGVEEDHLSVMEKEREAAELLAAENNSLSDTFNFTIPKSLGVATIELKKYTGELNALIEKQRKVKEASDAAAESLAAVAVVNKDFEDARKGGFFGIKLPYEISFNTAAAEESGFVPQIAIQGNDPIENRKKATEFLEKYVSDPVFREQIFRQQETVSGLSKQQSAETQELERIDRFGDPANPEFQDKLAAQKAGISLSEYKLRKVFTTTTPGLTGRSLFKGRGIEALKGKIVNGTAIGNVLRGRVLLAKRKLAAAPTSQDPLDFSDISNVEDELTAKQYVRFLVTRKGVGETFRLTPGENRILEKVKNGQIKGNRAEVLLEHGVDIGAVANSIDIDSALRFGAKQVELGGFNRLSSNGKTSDFDKLTKVEQVRALIGGRLGPAVPKHVAIKYSDVARMSTLEAQQYSVRNQAGIGGRADEAIAAVGGNATDFYNKNVTVTASADFYARNRMRDSNTNRLNLMGGTRVEGIPMDEEGAVVGGYSSRREYDQAMKGRAAASDRANQQLGAFFGVGINYSAIYGQSSARSQQSRLNSTVEGIRSSLASAGLSYKTTDARWRRGAGPAHYQYVVSEWAKVRAYNANQVNKAREINTLQQFGQSQFNGSQLSLPSLQDAVARQDEKVSTIGLNRTEAFQIIDTSGRGLDEIDARVLWKNRVNNISTGTSVL